MTAKNKGKASGLKVFVSSTYIDNVERRRIVENAIIAAEMIPVGMERFTAADRPAMDECIELVRECDCLVGIVAYRYGWIPDGQSRSITEIEYDAAVDAEKPRLMFISGSTTVDFENDIDEDRDRWEKQAKLDAFKEKIARDRMPAKFLDSSLGTQVLTALQRLREHLADDEPRDPEEISETELRRYLDKIEATYREVQLAGFETAVRVPLELEDLHVPLDAVLDHHGEGRDAFGAAHLTEKVKEAGRPGYRDQIPLAEAFTCARQLKRRGVILLGDPGSGKTTHLQQVLLGVVRRGPESIGLPEGTVPVFLSLRNLRGLEQGVPAFIEQELRDPLLSLAASFGPRLVVRGKLLFLLDGLDEVTDAAERAKVARWIEQARRARSDNYFLVSCRYAGYTQEIQLDASFIELHLRPMNDQQVRQFVTQWYRVVEKATHRDPAQGVLEAERRTKDLLETLSDTAFTSVARVYEMTHNPLLLTAICLVHRDIGRLPKERVKLYEEAVSVLLERWRAVTKELPVVLPAKQALKVLQPVAQWMHGEQGRVRATAEELRGPVEEGLAMLRDVKLQPETLLRAIRDESGLLTGWGVDRYGFMHLGFQEFLAARAIAERALEEVPPGQVGVLARLAGRFGESWWQEVILLLLAQGDRRMFERFMGEVVQQAEFVDWSKSQMMRLCLGEAGGVSARPFVELLQQGAEPKGLWGRLGRWWSRKPARDQRHEARQLAAARLLAQAMPEALEGLREVLQGHPADAVQRWWHHWRAQQGLGDGVIEAPRGGVELMLIPGGTFMMGESAEAHNVDLASFYLARTSVTNAQYGEYLKANPTAEKPKHWGDRRYNQREQPVVGVSWDEAKAYCEWAGLSLPTEAQWEYACRAGATTRYHSGDSEQDLARVGWYDDNSDHRLHAVGEKEPNDFGLYDMHGNVWEWCLDNYGSYATSPRPKDGFRHKPVGGSARVMRGGGWNSDAVNARSACRFRLRPGLRFDDLGFRPAQVIP